MSDVLFSVVIPCRNERRTLAACLDALRAQEFPPGRFEILVVDGGSTDGSDALARGRGVRVLEDPGRGAGAARNVGIRAARGGIVAFTDADCVARPDWLTSLAEAFAEHEDAGGVAGAMRMPRGTLLGRLEDNDAIAHYRGFITSNVAYRRDVLLEVGGFDESLLCCEDHDLAWRVIDAGHRIVHDRRPVVTHHCPEVGGGLAPYLRKQAWYARHDLPAHARAIRRFVRAPTECPGSVGALAGLAAPLRSAVWAGLVLGGLAARSGGALAAGLAGAAASAAWGIVKAARAADAGAREVPAMAAVATAKTLARGAGTLLGLADLARPSRWEYLRAPKRVSLGTRGAPAPASPVAPWARAVG